MRRVTRNTIILSGAVAALGLGPSARALADEGRDGGPHGGTLARTRSYHFEVVFTTRGLEVYPFTPWHRPVEAAGISGTATFSYPGSATPWFSCPLRAAAGTPGRAPTFVGAVTGLGAVPARGVTVTFCLTGLPDPSEPGVEFTVPFRLAPGGGVFFAPAAPADQEAVRAQKVCRVGGGELGWAPLAIKVTRGNRAVFVCCERCAAKVEADPDRYFDRQASPSAAGAGHDPGGHRSGPGIPRYRPA